MTQVDTENAARVMAGIPATNSSFYRRLRFSVGDPAALIELPNSVENGKSILILRDIEMGRARQHARVDEVHCPADFAPPDGLSGDRETATAQSVAECLRRHGIDQAIADRTLPLIFADQMQQAGITVHCDPEWGVIERRSKDQQEVEWLREAQKMTEGAMRMACELIASAAVNDDGVLMYDGQPLTSGRVRAAIDIWLMERNYSNPATIVACGPQAADCHNLGSGELRTRLPVIVDIFPRNRNTLYNGDCTRTVVHGEVSDQLLKMHAAVLSAKAAATEACRAGVTGQAVHEATKAAILAAGFAMGLPGEDDPDSYCAMTHGTGHGIGLDVHEPPLLDFGGPELVVGDALTIEPGLYSREIGGVRVEDMVIVRQDHCENLNTLHDGLTWN